MELQLILCAAAAVALLGGNPCFAMEETHALKLSNCKQSSDFPWKIKEVRCENAIDGNTNQFYKPQTSCSHAGAEPTGWWKAETEKPALIEYVQIYNRKDCCADRLTDFTISVDDHVCYTHDGTTFSVKRFKCFKMGTVLKIDSKKHFLTLCEVKAFGYYLEKNHALKLSSCKQSSDLPWKIKEVRCENAIDGNTNQFFKPQSSCSHAGAEPTGWWKAETEKPALIEYVQIYNRKDCCADRLTDFTISVDDHVCYTHDGTTFSVKRFKCFKMGTVLKIDSKKQYLTLCEVKAFGNYLEWSGGSHAPYHFWEITHIQVHTDLLV